MNKKKIKKELLKIAYILVLTCSYKEKYNASENYCEVYDLESNQKVNVEKINEVTEIQLNVCNQDISFLKEYKNVETLKIYNFGNNIDLSFIPNLSNLTSFTLYEKNKENTTDLSSLSQCQNLNYLEINSKTNLDLKLLKNMKNLEELFILNGQYLNYDILKEYKQIKILRIGVNNKLPENLLESLTNLKKLTIEIEETSDIDYQKLTFLEEISFGISEPYTIAIDFTNEDYQKLKENEVQITVPKNGIEKILSINDRLDGMIKELPITKNSTEIEKLDAILIYVTNHLEYDEKINDMISQNQDIRARAFSFYKEGLLYGALEKNTAICGNYASLLKALGKRLGLNIKYIENKIHAWNLVELNKTFYLVDPTFLDANYTNVEDKIKNDKEQLKWYKENINNIQDQWHKISGKKENDQNIKRIRRI